MTVGQAKADVGRAAGGVDAQFLAQAAHQGEHLQAGRCHRADGHHQRIDHDVVGRNAKVCGPLDDLLGHFKAHVGVFGNAGVVVGNRHDGHIVFLDQRQHQFQTLFLAGDRVQQRAAFGSGQTVFQRTGDRAVDAQGHVDNGLHPFDQRLHQHRLDKVVVGIAGIFGHLVREHGARVDVQNICAGGDLCQRVGLDAAEIVALKLFGQDLAAGGVDAFADHAKRLVKADDRGLGFGFNYGACHVVWSFRRWPVGQQRRRFRWPNGRWS